MAETGSRRGAAPNTSLILAVAAVAAISGLIYWLNVTAEPTQVEYVPEDTAAEEEPVTDVPVVALQELRAELAEYETIQIQMQEQVINSLLGDQAFWIGPQDNPFLVRMDSAALATTDSVVVNDTVNVRGRILSMSDSVLNSWEEIGVISGEGERAVASFAEYFMEANRVTPPGAEGGSQDPDTAGAGQAAGGPSDEPAGSG